MTLASTRAAPATLLGPVLALLGGIVRECVLRLTHECVDSVRLYLFCSLAPKLKIMLSIRLTLNTHLLN